MIIGGITISMHEAVNGTEHMNVHENYLILNYIYPLDTPWCPPDKWLRAVCKKFPELYINLEYDEPWCWFQWEMWRAEDWTLFDNYREWNDYLNTCYECELKTKDCKYREDFDEMMCDECYNKVLNNNK